MTKLLELIGTTASKYGLFPAVSIIALLLGGTAAKVSQSSGYGTLVSRDSHGIVQQQRVMKNVEAIALKVNNLNFSTYFGHAALLACKHCFPTGIVNTGGEFNTGDNFYSAYVKKNYGDKVQYSNESHRIGIINDYDIWVIGNTGLPVSSTSSDLDESKITLSTERGVCGAIPRLLFGIDAAGQKNFEFALLYHEMEITQNHLRYR